MAPDQGSPTRQAQPVPIVRRGRDGLEMALVQWWLLPYWSKERYVTFSAFNARAETVATVAAFREPFKRRRCLVPASGFFEWEPIAGQRHKQPWYFHPAHGNYFAFAGLWDRWRKDDQVVESCTIIVTRPNQTMARIHDRMPVILPSASWEAWLDPRNQDAPALQALLLPCADAALAAHRVSALVSNVRNDGPELIRPID